MSAYQASSKTLTFWVVAIVFLVTTRSARHKRHSLSRPLPMWLEVLTGTKRVRWIARWLTSTLL